MTDARILIEIFVRRVDIYLFVELFICSVSLFVLVVSLHWGTFYSFYLCIKFILFVDALI